jgi:peptide deformylase
MEIVQLGSDILREKSAAVTVFDDALASMTEEMFEIMLASNGIGLAAPQIGVLQRFFIVCLADGIRRVFVNPNILSTSAETAPGEEGCLSIKGVFHDVVRPTKIRVAAQDIRGRHFTMDAEAALARAVLHENDHLNGILYIDRLTASEKARIEVQYAKKRERKAAKAAERAARAAKIAARTAARG